MDPAIVVLCHRDDIIPTIGISRARAIARNRSRRAVGWGAASFTPGIGISIPRRHAGRHARAVRALWPIFELVAICKNCGALVAHGFASRTDDAPRGVIL